MYRLRINKMLRGKITSYNTFESKLFDTLNDIYKYIEEKFPESKYEICNFSDKEIKSISHIFIKKIEDSGVGSYDYSCLITETLLDKKGYINICKLYKEAGMRESNIDEIFVKVDDNKSYTDYIESEINKFDNYINTIDRKVISIGSNTITGEYDYDDVYNFKEVFLYNYDEKGRINELIRASIILKHVTESEYVEKML